MLPLMYTILYISDISCVCLVLYTSTVVVPNDVLSSYCVDSIGNFCTIFNDLFSVVQNLVIYMFIIHSYLSNIHNCIHLRTPKMRLVTVVMCVGYMVGAMLFFGLTLGASVLGVNPFIYMAIAGIVELPTCTLLIPVGNMIGRRKIIALSFGVSAVALLAQPLISDGLYCSL